MELAVGDFADPASMQLALRGVDRVFLASATVPDKVAEECAMIDVAAEHGVERIVKLSANGLAVDSPAAIWRRHAEIEQHLRTSGLAASILRANFFMTNLFAMAETIRQTGCFLPGGDARVAMIHPADVGAAAAAALAHQSDVEPVYTLTGPEAIMFSEVAERLSAAIGQPVSYVDVPDEQAQAGLVQSGAPEWLAAEVVSVFARLRSGCASDVTGTVEALTGRRPRSFGDFAQESAGAFGGALVAR